MNSRMVKKIEPDTGPGIEVDAIDRILARDGELAPSSGFFAGVMERVREEAAAPPPMPFPWKRAVPGIVLAAGVFGWGAVELVRLGVSAGSGISLALPHLPAAAMQPLESAAWVALALAVSVGSWILSRRLAR